MQSLISFSYPTAFAFQVVPSIINGGITALYFILWGKGLKSCGPLRYYLVVKQLQLVIWIYLVYCAPVTLISFVLLPI